VNVEKGLTYHSFSVIDTAPSNYKKWNALLVKSIVLFLQVSIRLFFAATEILPSIEAAQELRLNHLPIIPSPLVGQVFLGKSKLTICSIV
jgi:hypothetical protein